MSKILVTGGAGYIGAVLVPCLLEKGHQVEVIDNFLYNQTSLASSVSNKNLTLTLGDVRDQSLMKASISRADVIFPFAAIVGAPACNRDPHGAQSINKDALLWMFKQVSSAQQIIMPTTNSAYGGGIDGGVCDENSQLNPISLYARDKVLVEKSLMELENVASFRLATVFGISPRMRLDLLVNNFVYRAVNDKYLVLFEGHFKRNYIHLLDVVQAFILALENPTQFRGEVFNVGLSSANLSKIELCELIKLQVPNFVHFESKLGKDPVQRHYIVSNQKIEKLGFVPQVSLEEGIRELIVGMPMFSKQNFSNI